MNALQNKPNTHQKTESQYQKTKSKNYYYFTVFRFLYRWKDRLDLHSNYFCYDFQPSSPYSPPLLFQTALSKHNEMKLCS